MTKGGRDIDGVILGDSVIFWECLLFGVSTFDFLYLDVLCGIYLVLRLA